MPSSDFVIAVTDEIKSPSKETEQTPTDAKLQRLRDTLASLEAQRRSLSETLCPPISNTAGDDDIVVKALAMAREANQEHIQSLIRYNEIKDVATSLIGMIAESRQKRIIEVMQDFDVDEND